MDGGSREVIEVSTWVRSVVFTPSMGFDETGFLFIWGKYYLYHNKLMDVDLWQNKCWDHLGAWDHLGPAFVYTLSLRC